MAQRGARVPDPAASWSAARSALTTIPSMPNGSSARRPAMCSTRASTSSTVSTVRPETAVVAGVLTPSVAARSISSPWARERSASACSADVPGRGSRPYAKNVIGTV